MKKFLIISLFVPILFSSCINDPQINKPEETIKDIVVGFSVTSKNSEENAKSGKDLALNDMRTIKVKSGDKVLFKNFYFTLDNKVDGALNFFSKNGSLICKAPTKLSIMSMPPNGDGLVNYSAGENFEISAMTLIKIKSINFVITDFKLNNKID